MKRIIILRSNPVKPDPRVEKEASTLVAAGYSVQILAWDREKTYGYKLSKLMVNNQIIAITRIGIKASYGGGFKNIIQFLSFQLLLLLYLLKNISRYNIIHACDFDTAFTASLINIICKKKFIFDIFDFLYGKPVSLFQKIIRKLQCNIINKSDATIICSEARIQQIRGSKPQKLVIIHNSPINYDFKGIQTIGRCNDKIRIVYVGILQNHRLLCELVEAIAENPIFELHIAGIGKVEYKNFITTYAKTHNNIIFYGGIPYDKTLMLESSADIMLAIYDPSIENHIFAAPNKFYEALMLGKPLIMVKETGMSNIILQNKFGVLIDYNKQSLIDGLYRLVEHRAEWEQMSKNMKLYYLKNFDWRIMANRLKQLYANL